MSDVIRYQIQVHSQLSGWNPIIWMYQVGLDDDLEVCIQKTKSLISDYGHLSPIRLFDLELKKMVQL